MEPKTNLPVIFLDTGPVKDVIEKLCESRLVDLVRAQHRRITTLLTEAQEEGERQRVRSWQRVESLLATMRGQNEVPHLETRLAVSEVGRRLEELEKHMLSEST